MPDIFLSYAREDRPWASRLAAGLMEHGWSLFWDSHIPVGKTFDQVIENQLDAARCIVVLWSRHSISSNWVKAEASEGARRGILHPVLIENVRLPLEFRRLQTANLIDWQGPTSHAEFDQLIGGIAATLRSPTGLLQEARAALARGDYVRCLETLREIADAGLRDEVADLRRTAEAAQDEARGGGLRGQLPQAEEQGSAAEAAYEREEHDGATDGFEKAADAIQQYAPPPPARPGKRPKPRPTWKLGGSRLVACVGGIAVVLSAVGIYWYPSAHRETPKISTALPSAGPQPAESSPSSPSAEAPKVLAHKRDGIGGPENQIEVSNLTAAGTPVEKPASPQLTKATTLHQTARAVVAQGDHDTAGDLVQEASAASGNAAKTEQARPVRVAKLQEADVKREPVRDRVVGPPSGARTDAEQAQLRMAAAKRSAEQAAAGFFAHQRFTSAKSKERDGVAAFAKSDYAEAIRLLVEAQSEYAAAVPEARREAARRGQLAPLTASLEQAHVAAAAGRQQALAAEADYLAKDVFDQAQARQVEADGLESREELAAAALAYRDAAERYGEATLRARAARAAR